MAYIDRLLCLSLASFFLVHFFAGLLVNRLGAWANRFAGRMPARSAALFLFAFRLLPSTSALLVVAGLCIPSFVSLEPRGITEPVGPACIIAATLSLAIWGMALCRGLYAVACSLRYRRRITPKSSSPVFALVGIFRPKLVISREASTILSLEELQSAIRHERAHELSRDNLKRLVILLTPDILPFWNPFSAIERSWARFAEWAADDDAAGENVEHSLSLAAALVQVARLNGAAKSVPLTSFFADPSDLSERIDRLLCLDRRRIHRAGTTALPTILASMGLLVIVAARTETLRFIHQMLEHLIH